MENLMLQKFSRVYLTRSVGFSDFLVSEFGLIAYFNFSVFEICSQITRI